MYQYILCFFFLILITVNLIFPPSALAEVKLQIPSLAQIQTREKSMSTKAALERLFTSKQIQPEWFTSDFLAQVSIAQIRQVIVGLKNQLGAYQGIQNNCDLNHNLTKRTRHASKSLRTRYAS